MVVLAWHSGCLMDCQTTTWGSILGGDSIKRASSSSQGTLNGCIISK